MNQKNGIKTHCLDSDLLIGFLRGDESAKKTVTAYPNACTTILNALEVLVGAASNTKARERAELFLEAIPIYYFTWKEMHHAVEIQEILRKQGKSIGGNTMIAGICRANGLSLITRNNRHFSNVPKLKVHSW